MKFRLLTVGLMLVSLATGGSGPDTEWLNGSGKRVNPLAPRKQPSVLLFLMTDCPMANLYAPELKRIINEYSGKGIAFSLVYVDGTITPADVKRHTNEYGLTGQTLLDTVHSLAKRVGATVSPEAVVLNPAGKVVYCGRIDDRVAAYGKVREEPTRRDLRLTLDLMLKGKAIPNSRTKAIGCIFRVED